MSPPGFEFLPAPLWIIHVLHVVTLTLHFIAMNFVLGGIIFLLLARIDGGTYNPGAKRIIRLLPSMMAATITAGVAPLLFVQLVYPRQVYSASIASGWFWLFIIFAALIVYYLLYSVGFTEAGKRISGRLWLALAGMVYISIVYSSVFGMSERPDVYAALYAANPYGKALSPEPGHFLPRWFHMILGALTVGSYLVACVVRKDGLLVDKCRSFFTYGMIAAMLSGVFHLLSLNDIIPEIMRGPAVWVMTASILLSLGSLHFFWRKNLLMSGVTLIISLVGMVVLRHLVRLILLGEHYDPSMVPVQPQWGVFGIFLAVFLGGLGVCWWMAVLFNQKVD